MNHDSALVKMFVNPYAAIPSMHCAFALMIGATGALIARHTITRILWCVYPLFVLFVVIVTANHFWLDGAIGWVVAGVSALAAAQLARMRPAAWSFGSARRRLEQRDRRRAGSRRLSGPPPVPPLRRARPGRGRVSGSST